MEKHRPFVLLDEFSRPFFTGRCQQSRAHGRPFQPSGVGAGHLSVLSLRPDKARLCVSASHGSIHGREGVCSDSHQE